MIITILPMIIGCILLSMIVVCIVEMARRAAFPKCPGCGSRNGITSDDDGDTFTCRKCGEEWPEQ